MLKDFLVPAVLGRAWHSIEDLTGLYGKVKRNNFAKAGLEMACWDLLARAQGQPLHALLGGTRKNILSGVSLGIEDDIGQLFQQIDQALAAGYHRVKLKIGRGNDVTVVRQVRARYPDLPLMVDANAAYRLTDLPLLQELDAFDLMMIEQPLTQDDLLGHARLQQVLRTPICLDETISSTRAARDALALKSGRVINIKVSRLGGLLEAKRVHNLCRAQGVPVWCGGMHEFGIGRAANIAIASLPGFSLPGDVSGSDRYYASDVVIPPIRARNGALTVPDGVGLGYKVDESLVRRHTFRQLSLPA
jgi:O-succinylbenzoate synthase